MKPETTVHDCVSTLAHSKTTGYVIEMFGPFAAVLIATKLDLFDKAV